MARKFVSPQQALKVGPPRSTSSFNSLNFLRNPPNPLRAFGAWRHQHFVTRFIISGYCDISEWHVCFVRAHALPPASRLHLTNPCAEPKGMNRNPSAIILQCKQLLMMAYERSESTWDNFGKFIHKFQPETKTLIRKLERISKKL